ncbi:bZIP transcription factor 60 [Aristolochia californica]|uniref:bZIP transcription factor 60 n=1 Tax=Aristolochia californica TaxID=171875 RepID=UPI0035D6C695
MADVVERQLDSGCDIDWVMFFESIPDSGDLFPDDLSLSSDPSVELPAGGILGSSQASNSPELGEIEQFLLEDGNEVGGTLDGISEYMSDFLLDFPKAESGETRVSEDDVPSTDSNGEQDEEIRTAGEGLPSGENDVVEEKEETEKGDASYAINGGGEDGMNKKRKRQLRNRDSALRSRERKKLYVKDLEMKSKFMEGECRRLEFTLSCCMAENQILRQQLQSFGASVPKQESAALPLESLLLGSLFWLMSIVLLFHPLANKVGGLRTIKQDHEIEEAVREAGSEKEMGWKLVPYPLRRRLWKALRWKMKMVSHLIAVLIEIFYFSFGRWRNISIYYSV